MNSLTINKNKLQMTGFISSYSIKAEIITLVYNNRRLTKTNNKYRSYFVYICIGLLEIFLLCLWTLIGDKIEKRVAHIEQIGYYEYDNCSLGKEGLLSMIFVIDFALLSLPIITSYFGRKSTFFFFFFIFFFKKKIFFFFFFLILLLIIIIIIIYSIYINQ